MLEARALQPRANIPQAAETRSPAWAVHQYCAPQRRTQIVVAESDHRLCVRMQPHVVVRGADMRLRQKRPILYETRQGNARVERCKNGGDGEQRALEQPRLSMMSCGGRWEHSPLDHQEQLLRHPDWRVVVTDCLDRVNVSLTRPLQPTATDLAVTPSLGALLCD